MKKIFMYIAAAVLCVGLTACGAKITDIEVPTDIELTVGETQAFDVAFKSDKEVAPEKLVELGTALGVEVLVENPDIATVDEKYNVTGVASGSTDITIKAGEEIIKTIAVNVKQLPTKLVAEDLELDFDETGKVEVSFLPEKVDAGTKLSYSIADEDIATVDGYGKVTAVAAGKTKLTITNEFGVEVVVNITILEEVVEEPIKKEPIATTTNPNKGTATGNSGTNPTPAPTPTPTPPPVAPTPEPTPTPPPVAPPPTLPDVVPTPPPGQPSDNDLPSTIIPGDGNGPADHPGLG